MSLRTQSKFQRFEANDISSFEDALQGALNELEGQGLAGISGEPDVAIVLRQTGRLTPDGDKLLDAIVYIGATKEEISNDLLNPTS